jgi:hypothetical protein
VAYACNLIYSGGGNWKDCNSRPAWAKVSKILFQSII